MTLTTAELSVADPLSSPPPMPTFDIVVVGAGGGPDETNLSAYLLKPHKQLGKMAYLPWKQDQLKAP